MTRTSWYYYISTVLMTKPLVVVILLLWFFYRMMIAEKKPKGEREKVHSKTLLQLDSVLPFFACGLLPRPIHDVWVTTLFQALMEQHIVLSKNHSDHHHCLVCRMRAHAGKSEACCPTHKCWIPWLPSSGPAGRSSM